MKSNAAALKLNTLHHPFEAGSKAVDVEIQRIVVAVGDVSIDRRMESGDEPMFGPDAGDNLKQRPPLVLHGGETWVRSLGIVAAVPGAPPRLNHLDVDEKPLQSAGEIHRAFEFGLWRSRDPGAFRPCG